MVGARRDYERWRIRCCSLDDFTGWWRHARECAALLHPPSKALYCDDADPCWCAEQKLAGLCTAEAVTRQPVVRPQLTRHGQRLAAAVEWLRQYLADGPRLSTDVHRVAPQAGISASTLYKAALLLEVHREPAETHGYSRYYWSLILVD